MSVHDFIRIINVGCLSPAGSTSSNINISYSRKATLIKKIEVEGKACLAASLDRDTAALLDAIQSEASYRKVDRTVLMGIQCVRQLMNEVTAGYLKNSRVLINVGSSRGATGLFEKYYRQHLEKSSVAVQTSPTTTLGNLSSWIAQDIMSSGFCLSTSVTCSTASQAIGNALAWLKADMVDAAIAGACEAPLTAFTVSQMQALRIYASDVDLAFPCQPCASQKAKESGLVLGEGAALFLLEKVSEEKARCEDSIVVGGFGYGSEHLQHATSMSAEADCLYDSMAMALKQFGSTVDAVILHATGTERGDAAELTAINKIFPEALPILLSNKWLFGHTLGAAGGLSLDYAYRLLNGLSFIDFPYAVPFKNSSSRPIKSVMVNAAGFGGNAASIILHKL